MNIVLCLILAVISFQPGTGGREGEKETGAACYTRACTSYTGIRACYTCCNTNCTDMAGCQCKCDKSCLTTEKGMVVGPDISRIIRSVDRSDDKEMFELLTTPRFDAPFFGREAMEILDWATVAGSESIAKIAIATISDRYVSAEMTAETEALAESAILDACSDPRLGVRWTGLICIRESGLVHTSAGRHVLADRALNESDPQLAHEILTLIESLP